MEFHRNAKLGLAGRLVLVQAIERGMSLKAAAAALSECRRRRRTAGGIAGKRRASRRARACRAWSIARVDPAVARASSLPSCRSGSAPAAGRHAGVLRLVAAFTGFAHSTVWKVLKRAGLSRPARPPREPANRYEWPCPGDLLHVDVSRYARFERPGHAVTGDRSPRWRTLDALPAACRLRLRARDRRRPLAAGLRRASIATNGRRP